VNKLEEEEDKGRKHMMLKRKLSENALTSL